MSAHCKYCGKIITDDVDKHEHIRMGKSSFAAPAGSAYRLLSEGEIIEENDEFLDDSGVWRKTICAGEAAPNPVFTSHRQYRREYNTPNS